MKKEKLSARERWDDFSYLFRETVPWFLGIMIGGIVICCIVMAVTTENLTATIPDAFWWGITEALASAGCMVAYLGVSIVDAILDRRDFEEYEKKYGKIERKFEIGDVIDGGIPFVLSSALCAATIGTFTYGICYVSGKDFPPAFLWVLGAIGAIALLWGIAYTISRIAEAVAIKKERSNSSAEN